MANGTRALDAGDPFGSLVWYGEALRLDKGDPVREEAHRVRLATALRRCPRLVQVWFGNKDDAPAAISPDGRRVLLIQRDVARLWDVATGEAASTPMTHAAEITRAHFNAAGSRIVTTAADGTARVWDAGSGRPLTAVLRHDKVVSWAAFSPDGARLATVGAETARVWDAATGRLLIGPLKHDLPVLFASFSGDGKHLVTCGGDPDAHKGEIRVWDLTAQSQQRESCRAAWLSAGPISRRTASTWSPSAGGAWPTTGR